MIGEPRLLELGCGPTKRNPDAIGIDLLDVPGVDLVGDAVETLATMPEGSVDGISSEHFLEHIPDLPGLLREAARVLKPGAPFVATVPHFSSPYYYSDPTHRAPFGLYTFGYLVESQPFRRQVPHYDEPVPLALDTVRYHFKSSRPFYGRHAIKKTLGCWVNLSRWTQEFYEENVCWLMPAYEIEYRLHRI